MWIWDTANCQRTLTGHHPQVVSVAFGPDGGVLASGSKDGTLRLWDVKTGELKRTLKQIEIEISVAFSPDGATLASGNWARTVRLWDAETGELKRELTGHTGVVHSVAFSPDGKLLASGSKDMTVRLWAVETGESIQTLTGHIGCELCCVQSVGVACQWE